MLDLDQIGGEATVLWVALNLAIRYFYLNQSFSQSANDSHSHEFDGRNYERQRFEGNRALCLSFELLASLVVLSLSRSQSLSYSRALIQLAK